MRLIDADVLGIVLDKNFGGIGGAAVLQHLIDHQPTISPADNWTPCAERLPEEHKRGMIMGSDLVAVTVKNSKRTIYTAVDYTVNGKWETYEVMETNCTVLAWQPLPAPWTEEKKGEANNGLY